MNEDEPLSEEFRSAKFNQRRSMNLDFQFEAEVIGSHRQNNNQNSPFKSALGSSQANFRSVIDRNSNQVSFGNGANAGGLNNTSRISSNTIKTDMTHFYTANNHSNIQTRRTPAHSQALQVQFESNKLGEVSKDSLPNKSEDKSSIFLSNMNFDDERNFNKQEIEDFFGVDFKEMQKLVGASHRQNLNNPKPSLQLKHSNLGQEKISENLMEQKDLNSLSNTQSSHQLIKSALGGNSERISNNVRYGPFQVNNSGSSQRLEVIQEVNGLMHESQTCSDAKVDTFDDVDAEIDDSSNRNEDAPPTKRIMEQQDSLFKIGGKIDDQHLDEREIEALEDSIRLEELKLEQKNLEDTHGFILKNQFQRFGDIMNKFALRNSKMSQGSSQSISVTPFSDSVNKQRESKMEDGLKYESIQRPTASTSNSKVTTGVKSPFSVQKQQSVSSIHSVPMSAGGSSVRCSAISEINSHKSAKIKLRISDIIFKEAQAQDIEYILGSKTQFSPPQFRDLLSNEVMDVANINEWIETIKRQNQEDQIVEGVQLRNIVGSCCFYRQNNRLHQEREELKRVEDMIEQLQGKSSSRKDTQQPLTKHQQIAKKYEEMTLIGIILMQFQKPTDKDFPETLKLLPIFWPFRQKQQQNQEHLNDYKQSNQDQQQQQSSIPSDQQSKGNQQFNQNSQSSHHNHILNRDDLENHQLIQDRSLQEKAAKNQVAKILMLGVVPQCKRSGIGTLIYKKALHIIEQQFPHCVLIYYQRNPSFVSSNWRSIHSFLLKNHFKILNDSKLMGDSITEKTLFYYNITSLKLDKQRSINGLFAEFIKVVCRNPLALCNREGQKKIRKELRRAKLKYENEDLEDELEEFKTEQDAVAASQEINSQQQKSIGPLRVGQSRFGLQGQQQMEDQFEIPSQDYNQQQQLQYHHDFQQIARTRQHNLDNQV